MRIKRRAMRPRAADGAVEVIAAGLGRKLGIAFVADAAPENGIALEVKPLVVVIDEDVLGAPFPVDELSHSSPPAQFCGPPRLPVVWALGLSDRPRQCARNLTRLGRGRQRPLFVQRWPRTKRLDRLSGLTKTARSAWRVRIACQLAAGPQYPGATLDSFPKSACDTHAHVFGPPDIFPYADERRYTPPAAPVEHYRNMQRITGLSRAVFVSQPPMDTTTVSFWTPSPNWEIRRAASRTSTPHSTPSRCRPWPRAEYAARASI